MFTEDNEVTFEQRFRRRNGCMRAGDSRSQSGRKKDKHPGPEVQGLTKDLTVTD